MPIFLASGLTEDSQILRPTSAVGLEQYLVLVKMFKENLASNRSVVGKGRSILTAFSDNDGYPFGTAPKLDKWFRLVAP